MSDEHRESRLLCPICHQAVRSGQIDPGGGPWLSEHQTPDGRRCQGSGRGDGVPVSVVV